MKRGSTGRRKEFNTAPRGHVFRRVIIHIAGIVGFVHGLPLVPWRWGDGRNYSSALAANEFIAPRVTTQAQPDGE